LSSRSSAVVRGATAACLALAALLAAPAGAKVFHSRSEALAIAFPEADRIEDETLLLDDAQAQRIQALARSELESRLVRVYRGFKGEPARAGVPRAPGVHAQRPLVRAVRAEDPGPADAAGR
jgi:hypothetical protein